MIAAAAPTTNPTTRTICALDIGDARCLLAVLPPGGSNTTPLDLPRAEVPAAVRAALADQPGVLALEMTSGLELPILRDLEALPGLDIMIIKTVIPASLRKLLGRTRKTDRLDADLIARVAAMSLHPDTAAIVGDHLTPWPQMRTAVLVRPPVRHIQALDAALTRARLQRLRREDQLARDQLDEQIALLARQKAAAIADLEATAGPDEQLLTTIPGISLRRACLLTAAIGDVERFKSPHQLVRYLGLVPPHAPVSAGKQVGPPKIQRGLTMLAGELHMWALAQCRPTAQNDFAATIARYKSQDRTKVGMWSAKRQLIRTVWAMLTKHEPYRSRSTATPGP